MRGEWFLCIFFSIKVRKNIKYLIWPLLNEKKSPSLRIEVEKDRVAFAGTLAMK